MKYAVINWSNSWSDAVINCKIFVIVYYYLQKKLRAGWTEFVFSVIDVIDLEFIHAKSKCYLKTSIVIIIGEQSSK